MSTDMLASALQANGFRALVRSTTMASKGQSILRRLQHQHVVIAQEPFVEIIVDTTFREQFMLPGQCSAMYREMMDGIPLIFVGSRDELLEWVTFISQFLALEYTSRGMLVPPWRSLEALMSRWPDASSAAPWSSGIRRSRHDSLGGSDSISSDDGSDSAGTSRSGSSPMSVLYNPPAAAKASTVTAVFGFDVKSA